MESYTTSQAQAAVTYYGTDMNWMMFHGDGDPIYPPAESIALYDSVYAKLGVTSTIEYEITKSGAAHNLEQSYYTTMMNFIRGATVTTTSNDSNSTSNDSSSSSNDSSSSSNDSNSTSNDSSSTSNDSNSTSNDSSSTSNDSNSTSNDSNSTSNDSNSTSNDSNSTSNVPDVSEETPVSD